MFNYKKHCSDCEMLDREVRGYYKTPSAGNSSVANPIVYEEIAAFCMAVDEFCDQLKKCPLEDL